jgi:hypothetical protein
MTEVKTIPDMTDAELTELLGQIAADRERPALTDLQRRFLWTHEQRVRSELACRKSAADGL